MSINYKAIHYRILSTSTAQIFSPATRSQTPSVYVPPLMCETKFHTHTHNKHRKKNGGLIEHTRTTVVSLHSHFGCYTGPQVSEFGPSWLLVLLTQTDHIKGKSCFISKSVRFGSIHLIQAFSSYLTGNTSCLYYKAPPVHAVYCENHTKHTNTLCGKNAGHFDVTTGGTYSNHCSLKD
jgi:hypothetical protein